MGHMQSPLIKFSDYVIYLYLLISIVHAKFAK